MSNSSPYLITVDYPPETGGVARYLFELVKASKGEMKVIVPAGQGLGGDGVIAKSLFRTQWPRWWPVIGACLALKRKAKAILVSHVLPIGTAAMISRWLGGPKYVLLLHGLDIRLANRSFWKRVLFKMIVFFAGHIIVNSEATRRLFAQATGSDRPVTVIHPAVADHSFSDRKKARDVLGISPEEHIVLAVARLVERKGVDALIQSIQHLPPGDRIRVVIIGDGPESSKLHELARDSKHRIQFLSQTSDEHKWEWYAAANVFCLPVKDFSDDLEGFGIVFLEAALAGLPVIAGKSGGVSEAVVDRETGILVNSNDTKEIGRALMMLLGDPDLQKRYGLAGRERALRDFRWEDRWESYQKIFDTL